MKVLDLRQTGLCVMHQLVGVLSPCTLPFDFLVRSQKSTPTKHTVLQGDTTNCL